MPVVDASVVVDWVAPDADPSGPAATLLKRLADAAAVLLAPPLLLQEVGNALLTGVRRDRWSAEDADTGFALLRRMPVTYDDDAVDIDRAWDLARRFDEHPIHDMIYVALADRTGEVLITADDRLRARLRRPGRVIAPEDWTA
jgi:predicted nucleic acid-binding protein